MNDMNDKNDFLELLMKAHEGTITPEEVRLLNERIQGDDAAARLYAEFFDTMSGLVDLSGMSVSFDDSDSTGLDIWFDYLAKDEKSAPALEMPKHKVPQELVQKVVYVKSPRHISKLSIYSAVLSAAAIFLLVLFVRFMPPKGGLEVATLKDTINAKWADTDTPMQAGTRIFADGRQLLLREGLAELEFDSHASVVIEAPAEFQILAEDRIGLRYGKVYATVPTEAIGFSVYTSNAKVIDMGTEFGVEADTRGDTRLHVIKGRTMLIAGHKSDKASIAVDKGSAKKISAVSSAISDIPCDTDFFVRGFDSKAGIVWRDESLDLADIARGGNGRGISGLDVWLHPTKGFTSNPYNNFSQGEGYLMLPDTAFIDGVFVPNGYTEQIVSSRGDVFKECPATSGVFNTIFFSNPKPEFWKTSLREGTIRFNGQAYAQGGNACIVMHANLGITFDLDAIRDSYKSSIRRFDSQVGIADLKEACACNADFWVLVDGQIRYSLQQYKQKGVLNDVSIEINDSDRFLTLITTDGGDPDDPGHFYTRAISCDWGVFAEPSLILE